MNKQPAKNRLADLFAMLRPQHWIKNGFVFAGVIFGESFGDYHIYFDAALTFVVFCLVSSCAYIFNDLIDFRRDQLHPQKKLRPLPAGKITIPCAFYTMLLIGFAGLILALFVSADVALIALAYIFLNLLYSYWLKHFVIIDVFCISAGFMLRILAGTYGIGIPPSEWLLLCAMMVTLFLGFAKRRAELITLDKQPGHYRKVLVHYGPIFLDEVIAICASGVIITYCLYATSPETIAANGSNKLVFTVLFVIYGLFRYLYLLHQHHLGADPARDLLQDRHIIASFIAWIASSLAILSLS